MNIDKIKHAKTKFIIIHMILFVIFAIITATIYFVAFFGNSNIFDSTAGIYLVSIGLPILLVAVVLEFAFFIASFAIKSVEYKINDEIYYLYCGFSKKMLFKGEKLMDMSNQDVLFNRLILTSKSDDCLLTVEINAFGKPIIRLNDEILLIKGKRAR